MARIKYYYDTESCRYERIKVSTWDIIWNALGFLTLALLLSVGIVFVYIKYFESPEEALLRKENEELRLYYDLLSKEVNDANEMLASLQERDDNIYRVIMGVEPIPEEIRTAGFGGANRYKNLLDQGLEREQLVMENYQRIDQLKKQMYIQTKSYDEIMALAKDKELLLASLPAIQPVSNENLKRLSSGFGYRIDPILKVRKPHNGVDFSLPQGTPIYATGDGTVKFTRSSYTGYGKQIEIDHGFGYTTKYAHLSEFVVKRGQKVKRGELIAYSGNTGKSTAPHLHYEVKIDGKPVDPVHYFYKDIDPDEYEEVLRLAAIENQALGSY
ncbi:peptidoglycan DD-metalloendopeptidase family protein [Marinoscillum furvescens]|uniref:Peptidase M23-like protein n=1 Tax=Marinoscillum furvescens DSM 4134 TaxID=1122208 RepID=A0A3D9L1A9_MARFU|nr:peptidoglycan DD-metalloendopeptidase family protein [Marinoscillum furvescens]RED95608.1 peptidase M23-like protein [Marinoscillum furvescens DSM 4134]